MKIYYDRSRSFESCPHHKNLSNIPGLITAISSINCTTICENFVTENTKEQYIICETPRERKLKLFNNIKL